MTRFTRPLAVASFLCTALPMMAQTTVPLDRQPRRITLKEVMEIASEQANASEKVDAVRVQLRVVRTSDKECREALAKLCEKKPACLTEKELFAVLERCAGDRTCTILHAPRMTLDAGRAGTVAACDKATFTTAVTAKVVNGKTVMVPSTDEVELGGKFTATATPSKDGKSFELQLAYHEKQVDGPVSLLPVTTLVSPVGNGEPVPYTTFVQMPKFRELKLAETVTVPDGGTVALFAGTGKATKRVEEGVPVLSRIPYVNRLFKNVGVAEVEESVVVFASLGREKAEACEPAKLVPAGARTAVRGATVTADLKVRPMVASVGPPIDVDLAKLLAAYQRACETGKTNEAARLAVQALAKDPTCFKK